MHTKTIWLLLLPASAAPPQLTRTPSPAASPSPCPLLYPRNAIIGFTSLALEDGDLQPPIDGYVEGSLQGARNLLSILSQIIEFSKIVHGTEEDVEVDHIELARDPFSLVQVACDLIDIVSFRVRHPTTPPNRRFGTAIQKSERLGVR